MPARYRAATWPANHKRVTLRRWRAQSPPQLVRPIAPVKMFAVLVLAVVVAFVAGAWAQPRLAAFAAAGDVSITVVSKLDCATRVEIGAVGGAQSAFTATARADLAPGGGAHVRFRVPLEGAAAVRYTGCDGAAGALTFGYITPGAGLEAIVAIDEDGAQAWDRRAF